MSDASKRLVYWDSNPNPSRTHGFRHSGESICQAHGLEFAYVPKNVRTYVADVLEAWENDEGPDIIDVWPEWVPALRESGQLLDLGPFLTDWSASSDYDPNHARLSLERDGACHFLACDLFIQGTHYRADAFENQKEIEPAVLDAQDRWDLAAFIRSARMAHCPSQERFGLSWRGGQGGYLTVFNLIASACPEAMSKRASLADALRTPDASAALQMLVTLIQPPSVVQPRFAEESYREFAWHFYEGRAAMMLHNDDGVKAEQQQFLGPDNYRSCRLPHHGEAPWLALAGFGLGARRGRFDDALLADYICQFVEKYGANLLYGAVAQGEVDSPGACPGPMRPWPDPLMPQLQPFHQHLDNEGPWFELPFSAPGYSAFIRDLVEPDLQRIWRNPQTAKEFLPRWADNLDALAE